MQELFSALSLWLSAHPLITGWYTAIARLLFPVLSALILVRAIRSLLRIPHTPEVWAIFLLRQNVNNRVRCFRIDFSRISVIHTKHVPCKFNNCNLHTKANAEIRDTVSSCILASVNLA